MVDPLKEVVQTGVGRIEVAPWRPGTLERKPVQAVLVCMPTRLAGQGTARQLAEAYRVLKPELEAAAVPLGYVGPAIPGNAELSVPLAEVEPAPGDVALTYRRVHEAVGLAFDSLWARGVRRVAVLSMGYTSYGPEAVRRVLAARRPETRMEAVVCLVDSAYPDVASLEEEAPGGRGPIGRFYGPSYRAGEGYETAFLLTSSYAYDPAILNRRAPAGLAGAAVISPPYSDEYVAELEQLGAEGKTLGGKAFGDLIPGMSFFSEDDLLVPLAASDIWSHSAVGEWMTPDQHTSSLLGTKKLVEALVGVSERLGRRVWVPMDLAGAKFVGSLGLARVAAWPPIAENGPSRGEKVVVCGYRDLSQPDHARLLGAADLAISRTGGQANASVVLALARTPNLVVDLPACGYMQSELTSLAIVHDLSVDRSGQVTARPRKEPLGAVAHWSWPRNRLRDLILRLVKPGDSAGRLADTCYAEYRNLREQHGHSLVGIVRELIGHSRL